MITWGLIGRLLALLTTLLVAPIAGGSDTPLSAAASSAPAAYTYDKFAYVYDAPALPSSPDTVATGLRGSPERPEATSWASPASAQDDFVAANTAGEVVRYSPQAASRNLLGQVGEGFATTPGGRTVSAHAADRIVNGAAGRPPTTLSRVDSILDNPTAIRYDPLRDTVRVSQGNAFVVVRGSGSGQHIVTVMVP